MPTGTITTSVELAGLNFAGTTRRSDAGQIGQDPALPAGKSGTLSTRTDADTGVATCESGHGITDSMTVDVYWSGGMRYGMTVTNVSTDDVSVDSGAGDDLPTQDTVLIVTPRIEVDVDFDGDLLKMIAVHATKRAHVEFLTDADASILALELTTAEEIWSWAEGQGAVANPLASNVVGKLQVTCGEASAGQLTMGVLYDSDG